MPTPSVACCLSGGGLQEELGLGPNGGLVYCMDYLESNLDWLREQLAPLEAGEALRNQTARPGCSPPALTSAARHNHLPPRRRSLRAPAFPDSSCALCNTCLPALPAAEGAYLLFDLPGQVELFTLHGSLRRIVDVLTRKWRYRLAVVQLVDAHLCRWAAGGRPAGAPLSAERA